LNEALDMWPVLQDDPTERDHLLPVIAAINMADLTRTLELSEYRKAEKIMNCPSNLCRVSTEIHREKTMVG